MSAPTQSAQGGCLAADAAQQQQKMDLQPQPPSCSQGPLKWVCKEDLRNNSGLIPVPSVSFSLPEQHPDSTVSERGALALSSPNGCPHPEPQRMAFPMGNKCVCCPSPCELLPCLF